jgi:hypothetical protein
MGEQQIVPGLRHDPRAGNKGPGAVLRRGFEISHGGGAAGRWLLDKTGMLNIPLQSAVESNS